MYISMLTTSLKSCTPPAPQMHVSFKQCALNYTSTTAAGSLPMSTQALLISYRYFLYICAFRHFFIPSDCYIYRACLVFLFIPPGSKMHGLNINFVNSEVVSFIINKEFFLTFNILKNLENSNV